MSQDKLDNLTSREADLISHVNARVGLMEQKEVELREDGTTSAYRELMSDYLLLAASGSIEALKRAVFIGWYARSEPECFTGLGDITDAQFIQSQEIAAQWLDSCDADDEFAAMLGYCVRVYDWFGGSSSADRLASQARQFVDLPGPWTSYDLAQFAMRGAMGDYFSSIISARPFGRPLREEERRIIKLIQAYYGPLNNNEDLVKWIEGDATLWVADRGGENVLMVNLTNLATWRSDGTITSDEELERDWLRINPRLTSRRGLAGEAVVERLRRWVRKAPHVH